MHQSLHARFGNDPGADSVDVSGACQGDLRAAWGTCLAARAVGADPTAATDQLEAEIADADRAARGANGPAGWANESFAVATAPAMGYCVQANDVCRYEAGNVALDPGEPGKTVAVDPAYVAMSNPIVRDRLKRAIAHDMRASGSLGWLVAAGADDR